MTLTLDCCLQTPYASVDIRAQQDIESVHRLEHICSKVPLVFDPERHGAHRWCYKSFTNTSHLRSARQSSSATVERTSKRRRIVTSDIASSSSTSALFPRECIFCGTVNRCVSGKKQILRQCQTKDTEDSIKRAAVEKNDFDLLGKIADCDLIAKEAVYHECCRRNYTTRTDRQHHLPSVQNLHELEAAAERRSAHNDAFTHIC